MTELYELLEKARNLSWDRFGKEITFYYPGMYVYNGERGSYPAVSITGKFCELKCNHCNGKLLENMIPALNQQSLIDVCKKIEEDGNEGVLITGGCSLNGSLPWKEFAPAIKFVKENFNLFVSVHTGIISPDDVKRLKEAKIDQALIDVIGDDNTIKRVYRLDFGVEEIENSLKALKDENIPTIPHIVVGLDYGKVIGEYNAIKIVKDFEPETLVFVSLTPLSGTNMKNVKPPDAEEIAILMAKARLEMPKTQISLGCIRERGNRRIDVLAVECGANKIAVPSDQAINKAKEFGLKINWRKTCCSLPKK
jgi:hypothetical protein